MSEFIESLRRCVLCDTMLEFRDNGANYKFKGHTEEFCKGALVGRCNMLETRLIQARQYVADHRDRYYELLIKHRELERQVAESNKITVEEIDRWMGKRVTVEPESEKTEGKFGAAGLPEPEHGWCRNHLTEHNWKRVVDTQTWLCSFCGATR